MVELASTEDVDDENLAWEDRLMNSSDATRFRAVVARLNFLSIDRADIQYATKEAARKMARPTNGDWQLVTRIGKYLILRPRVVHMFRWQSLPGKVGVFVDSNWAGCPKTRRSTTGVCVMHGEHSIRTFSKTQSNVALSSAEAELYAMVAAASEGIGTKAMAADFGAKCRWTFMQTHRLPLA